MPEYLHPGVYIEEIERGPRPIEGVPTSTAAFLGETERGPIRPRLVTSYKDYQRWFGGVFGATSSCRTPSTASSRTAASASSSAASSATRPRPPTADVRRLHRARGRARALGQARLRARSRTAPPKPRARERQSAADRASACSSRTGASMPSGLQPFDPFDRYDDAAAARAGRGLRRSRHSTSVAGLLRQARQRNSALVELESSANPRGDLRDARPADGARHWRQDGADDAEPLGVDDYRGETVPTRASETRASRRSSSIRTATSRSSMRRHRRQGDIGRRSSSHCENLRFRFAVIDCDKGVSSRTASSIPRTKLPGHAVRRVLLPVDRHRGSADRRAQADAAGRPRARRLRAHRHRARRVQGAGQRDRARRARPRVRHQRRDAGRAQSARRQRHPQLPRPRHPRLGRAHADVERAVEVRQRAAAVHLPRALDLRGHAVGRVRAERRPPVGARHRHDPAVPARAVARSARCSAAPRRRRSSSPATAPR